MKEKRERKSEEQRRNEVGVVCCWCLVRVCVLVCVCVCRFKTPPCVLAKRTCLDLVGLVADCHRVRDIRAEPYIAAEEFWWTLLLSRPSTCRTRHGRVLNGVPPTGCGDTLRELCLRTHFSSVSGFAPLRVDIYLAGVIRTDTRCVWSSRGNRHAPLLCHLLRHWH